MESFVNDINASTLKVRNFSEFSGILDLSSQTVPQITLDSGEYISYDKSTNILSLSGGAAIETGVLKTSTGVVDISTNGLPPATGYLLTATSAITAEWQDSVANSLVTSSESVNISSSTAPSVGQVLTAENSTTASWQDEFSSGLTLLASAGSRTVPSYSFTGDTDTGIYSGGLGEVNATSDGTEILLIYSLGLYVPPESGIYIGNFNINMDSAFTTVGSVSIGTSIAEENFDSTGITTVDMTGLILTGMSITSLTYIFDNAPAGPATFSLGTIADPTKWFNGATVGTGQTGRIGGAFEYFNADTTVRLTFNTATTGTANPGFKLGIFTMRINTP